MRYSMLLAAVAATFVAASPAAAQVVATGNPVAKGVVVLPLTLQKNADLDFGTVVASPSVAGTVAISADDGSRAVTGGVVGVLSLQAPAVLASGSNTITVQSMTFDTAAASTVVAGNQTTSRLIDGSGAFQVGVGGVFQIKAGQANGVYSAPFIVTADYQ
jgi:hypothetical protein